MKNILLEKPKAYEDLYGRTQFTCNLMREALNGKDVINIGCGFGWFEHFACDAGMVRSIVGIEPNCSDLSIAKKHLKNPRIQFEVGNALELPFENRSFDVATSWDVLEHLPKASEERFFSEVARVLRPDGIFVLSTPFSNPKSTLTDPAWYFTGHRHYDLNQMEVFSNSAGLCLRKSFVAGGFWDILGTWNLYISKWIFHRSPFFEQKIGLLQTREYARKEGFMTLFAEFQVDTK